MIGCVRSGALVTPCHAQVVTRRPYPRRARETKLMYDFTSGHSDPDTRSNQRRHAMFFDFVGDLFIQLTQFVLGLDSWLQVLSLMLIGAIPFIESYLGSFLGTIVGISPFLAVPAAVIGNIVCTFVLIALASRVRTAATRGRERTGDEQMTKRRKKVVTYLERFGVPGVALLGPLVVASQITAPTLIAVGARKSSVYLWTGISIALWGILFGFFAELVVTWVM